ncbi:ammonium transporter [Rhodococcus kronopolitis]|uniref:Ammonium transporter n=1 Tax=Rhodococcus kronopolitis TaxID=1460226 RepID=A0ABV9FVA8_9NOCA
MRMKKLAATAVLSIAALGIGAGTAYAAPAAPATDGNINWESNVEGKSVVTTIDAGAFKVSGDGKNVELQDGNGNAVVSLPLAFQLADLQFPMTQTVSEDGKTLTMTPVFDLGKAKPIAAEAKGDRTVSGIAIKDIASPEENLMAQQTFTSQLAVATASGGLIGTIIGAVVGTFIMPAIGTITGAGVGGIAGTVIVGGPTLIAAGIGLAQTLTAAPGTTMYAK